MENKMEKQNEEALMNAFKIEELEERLETNAWLTGGCDGSCTVPPGS